MEDDDLVGTLETVRPSKKRAAQPGLSPPKTRTRARRYDPTDEDRLKVIAWTSAGTPQTVMAQLLRIDAVTLRRHYRFELDNGMLQANAMIADGLFSRAMAGDISALIFWCKARLMWRERGQYDAENPLVIKGDTPAVDPHALARELRTALLELREVTPALPSP